MTERKDANTSHPPRSSLFPRNAHTFAFQMAMEAAQRAEVGQRIRDLRGPLPQPELARKLNVSLRAVQKWEGGESAPQWDNLVRLSKYFGVTQDFLLYGDRPEPEASQLDRIEARLEEIFTLLAAQELPEAFEQAAAQADAQQAQSAAKPPQHLAKRKAS